MEFVEVGHFLGCCVMYLHMYVGTFLVYTYVQGCDELGVYSNFISSTFIEGEKVNWIWEAMK